MNARTYDIGIGGGLLCVAGGVYLSWGIGPALMTAGVLMIALTLFAALMGGKS